MKIYIYFIVILLCSASCNHNWYNRASIDSFTSGKESHSIQDSVLIRLYVSDKIAAQGVRLKIEVSGQWAYERQIPKIKNGEVFIDTVAVVPTLGYRTGIFLIILDTKNHNLAKRLISTNYKVVDILYGHFYDDYSLLLRAFLIEYHGDD